MPYIDESVYNDLVNHLCTNTPDEVDRTPQSVLLPEQVEWIVMHGDNNLGVKIGDQIFTLWKGESLLRAPVNEDGPAKWRPVGKREFGEDIVTNFAHEEHDWHDHPGASQHQTELSPGERETLHRRNVEAALTNLQSVLVRANLDGVNLSLSLEPRTFKIHCG